MRHHFPLAQPFLAFTTQYQRQVPPRTFRRPPHFVETEKRRQTKKRVCRPHASIVFASVLSGAEIGRHLKCHQKHFPCRHFWHRFCRHFPESGVRAPRRQIFLSPLLSPFLTPFSVATLGEERGGSASMDIFSVAVSDTVLVATFGWVCGVCRGGCVCTPQCFWPRNSSYSVQVRTWKTHGNGKEFGNAGGSFGHCCLFSTTTFSCIR